MIVDWLAAQLRAGGFSIGQVCVSPEFQLQHFDDAEPEECFFRPEDAREIAKYDDAGVYRPLKTAPNLRHGWRLRLTSVAEVRLALDLLYPAAIGTWIAYERGEITPVDLRDTLSRQTGMYRVTHRITDDQAAEVIRRRCDRKAGCLRRQLWKISPTMNSPFTEAVIERGEGSIPILCVEACNLLVADCRPVAKQNLPKAD